MSASSCHPRPLRLSRMATGLGPRVPDWCREPDTSTRSPSRWSWKREAERLRIILEGK